MSAARSAAAAVLLFGWMPCLGQGFPFPVTPTRTPRPTVAPSRTPTRPPVASSPTPTPTRTVGAVTPTPLPAGAACFVPWPTPLPGAAIYLHYRWTGRGACFDTVSSERLGPSADVFLSVNGGEYRRVRWAPDCWQYEDGSVPYAFPTVATGPVTFRWEIRPAVGKAERTAVTFAPPIHVRE